MPGPRFAYFRELCYNYKIRKKSNAPPAIGRRGERGGEAGEPAAFSMTNGENTILQGKIFEPLIKFTLPLMLAI